MSGYIVYQGPSLINGAPIVAVATMRSNNVKTGDMVQLWILSDEGKAPSEAVKAGIDSSVCGACVHRGEGNGKSRSCYVTLHHGPLAVWRAYQGGAYHASLEQAARACSGRMVRLGAYGDPGAVPPHVLHTLVGQAKGWTGYTHQWKNKPWLRSLCMASTDTEQERVQARAAGWRVFHVAPQDATEPAPGTVWCPATVEGGSRALCVTCGACDGAPRSRSAKRRGISVLAHGVGKRYHTERLSADDEARRAQVRAAVRAAQVGS